MKLNFMITEKSSLATCGALFLRVDVGVGFGFDDDIDVDVVTVIVAIVIRRYRIFCGLFSRCEKPKISNAFLIERVTLGGKKV